MTEAGSEQASLWFQNICWQKAFSLTAITPLLVDSESRMEDI